MFVVTRAEALAAGLRIQTIRIRRKRRVRPMTDATRATRPRRRSGVRDKYSPKRAVRILWSARAIDVSTAKAILRDVESRRKARFIVQADNGRCWRVQWRAAVRHVLSGRIVRFDAAGTNKYFTRAVERSIIIDRVRAAFRREHPSTRSAYDWALPGNPPRRPRWTAERQQSTDESWAHALACIR